MDIVFECPHCKHIFVMNINELNCRIIRHAVFKNNFVQVNPHLSKEECDKLVKEDLVYGCCKPAKIIQNNDEFVAIECDYI